MGVAGIAASLIALAVSFGSQKRSRVHTAALENLLAVSQLRACAILKVPALPMVAGRVATLATDGRTIFYNEAFVRQAIGSVCQRAPCVEGLVLAMVSHELAHAYRHPKATPGHKIELEADYVAGYVLGRVGMEPDDFVTVLGTFRETMLHPPAQTRAVEVRKGFARGTAERMKR
jgi:hypothetical protein